MLATCAAPHIKDDRIAGVFDARIDVAQFEIVGKMVTDQTRAVAMAGVAYETDRHRRLIRPVLAATGHVARCKQ